jgi:hypothetical protein
MPESPMRLVYVVMMEPHGKYVMDPEIPVAHKE